jgi:amidase
LLSALDLARAENALHAYTRRVSIWWQAHDLLLLPTITDVPPRLGEIRGDATPEALLEMRRRYGWLTPPWNITGQPAISLPIGWSRDGLPLGVQLVAAIGREDLLLGVAAQLETVFDWPSRRPPHGALAESG